jgi:four helix bundle protein
MLRFDHHRLDAFKVARDVLRSGDAIARQLPRGYGTLADQLRRSVLSAYLGIAEASSRSGADRVARFRCARGEASEAAAALEAIQLLRLTPDSQTDPVLALLDRLCAMLTRLARLTRHDVVPISDTPAAPPPPPTPSPPSDTNSNSLTLTPTVPVPGPVRSRS